MLRVCQPQCFYLALKLERLRRELEQNSSCRNKIPKKIRRRTKKKVEVDVIILDVGTGDFANP